MNGRLFLFWQLVTLGLNPKAFVRNIGEYMQLQQLCQKSSHNSLLNFSRVFLLGRGIRGVEGLKVANVVWKKTRVQVL